MSEIQSIKWEDAGAGSVWVSDARGMKYRIVEACRLCDSADLAPVLDLGATPLANELDGADLFPLVVNRCGGCDHHQLSIAVSPARLWGPSYPYQSGTSPVFREHLAKLADEVAALKPGGRVLEIASNDGTLVRMLHERGCYPLGVDPSGPDLGETDLTLVRETWPWELLSRVIKQDCVIALNVFAHVDDLHSFTVAVKERLAPDGVFIIEVGYLLDVIERGLFDVIYHEHFSYHHVKPLVAFFERHGLRIDKVQHVDSQGGSIRIYVKHMTEVPWYDASGEAEPAIGHLRNVIDVRAGALREGLEKLQARGEMICGYGAPAKLTTFMYATGMHEYAKLNCIGDDNPLKIGRATPGLHIPIVSVADMLAKEPDTIVVFSWNFFDDIRDKLRRLGFAGGIVNPMQSVVS